MEYEKFKITCFSTEQTWYSQEDERNQFEPHKKAKIRFNYHKEVKSAKLFCNNNQLIIRNLSKLEPLSHIIDDESLIRFLGNIYKELYVLTFGIDTTTQNDYTTLSHLQIVKPNIKGENFEVKRSKNKKKA